MLRYAWCLVLAVLAGCTPSYAPVVDKYGVEAPVTPVTRGSHRVKPGETLYSIAWRYGRDYRELAAANGIRPPYTIYPGQAIRLGRAAPPTASRPPAPKSSGAATPGPTTTRAPAPAGGPITWQWPASGGLLSGFAAGQATRQGISIGGRAGDPVRAAAPGVVVYRGNGLTGYGNLLIIKHDERWLSAYAHNSRMLVSEGQAVKAGEQIATIGDTGTFRTQLHFEVRRDGVPIDPLTVLPTR